MREGDSLVHRTVFGRGGRSGGVSPVGLVPQMVNGELGAALDKFVSYFFQKLLVAGVVVVFPDMRGKPRSGGGVEIP